MPSGKENLISDLKVALDNIHCSLFVYSHESAPTDPAVLMVFPGEFTGNDVAQCEQFARGGGTPERAVAVVDFADGNGLLVMIAQHAEENLKRDLLATIWGCIRANALISNPVVVKEDRVTPKEQMN